MKPLDAEELKALRATCQKARDYWALGLPDDDEARENWNFYRDVLRLIKFYTPPAGTNV